MEQAPRIDIIEKPHNPATTDVFNATQFLNEFRETYGNTNFRHSSLFPTSHKSEEQDILTRANKLFSHQQEQLARLLPEINISDSTIAKARKYYLASIKYIGIILIKKGYDTNDGLRDSFFDPEKNQIILEQLARDMRRNVFLLSDLPAKKNISSNTMESTKPHINGPEKISRIVNDYQDLGKGVIKIVLARTPRQPEKRLDKVRARFQKLKQDPRFFDITDKDLMYYAVAESYRIRRETQARSLIEQKFTETPAEFIEKVRQGSRTESQASKGGKISDFVDAKTRAIIETNSAKIYQKLQALQDLYGDEFTAIHSKRITEVFNSVLRHFYVKAEKFNKNGVVNTQLLLTSENYQQDIFDNLLSDFIEIFKIFSNLSRKKVVSAYRIRCVRPDIYTPNEVKTIIDRLSPDYTPDAIFTAFTNRINDPVGYRTSTAIKARKPRLSLAKLLQDKRFIDVPAGEIIKIFEICEKPDDIQRLLLYRAATKYSKRNR